MPAIRRLNPDQNPVLQLGGWVANQKNRPPDLSDSRFFFVPESRYEIAPSTVLNSFFSFLSSVTMTFVVSISPATLAAF